METKKPIHVKPSLYAYYLEPLKIIAKEYGYNLVVHGSMSRDLDLIAIPWEEEVGNVDKMIQQFCDILGGVIFTNRTDTHIVKTEKPHGRIVYVININRGEYKGHDPEYYLDISVMPTLKKSL